jgi:alkylhydroperoxidase/carboxymuconolactone decarboxylase family protein YurZ
MNNGDDRETFHNRLTAFQPRVHGKTRSLALYSAATAAADEKLLDRTIEIGRRHAVTHNEFYEVVLQSYLFLGFPRMLAAADHLSRHFRTSNRKSLLHKISEAESEAWFTNGIQLCQRVYADNYSPLRQKVEACAPEVFRWMVIEGYGKVLSRPGLGIVDRELCIISSLMMENREKQLYAHVRGASNVGAPYELIRYVIDDLSEAAGKGYETSLSILNKLGLV